MKKTITIAAFLIVASATLTGCSTIKDVVDVAGPIVDAVNEEDTWITVGDCFNETGDEIVSDVPTIDCALPHDYEVYASIQLDKAVWPGDDEIFSLADDACLAPFATWVGIPFENSTLDYTYYVPTEDGWNNYDDREVSCIMFDPAGQTTGTFLASGR
jgi:predicted small secreted protein